MPVYAVSGWSGLSGRPLFLIVAIVGIVTIGGELRANYERITNKLRANLLYEEKMREYD